MIDPVDSPKDLLKQRDSLLLVVEGLKQRIYHLRDLLEEIYRKPDEVKALIREELANWEEP